LGNLVIEVIDALHEVENLTIEVADALREVENLVIEVADALREVDDLMIEVVDAFHEVENLVIEVIDALHEVGQPHHPGGLKPLKGRGLVGIHTSARHDWKSPQGETPRRMQRNRPHYAV
jgi:hypothetical protein